METVVSQTVEIEGTYVTLPLAMLDADTYTVLAKYSGDSNNPPSDWVEESFTVSKVQAAIGIEWTPTPYQEEGMTFFNVGVVVTIDPHMASGSVTITIPDEYQRTINNIVDGKVVDTIRDLNEGTYTLQCTYSGDRNCLPVSDQVTFILH